MDRICQNYQIRKGLMKSTQIGSIIVFSYFHKDPSKKPTNIVGVVVHKYSRGLYVSVLSCHGYEMKFRNWHKYGIDQGFYLREDSDSIYVHNVVSPVIYNYEVSDTYRTTKRCNSHDFVDNYSKVINSNYKLIYIDRVNINSRLSTVTCPSVAPIEKSILYTIIDNEFGGYVSINSDFINQNDLSIRKRSYYTAIMNKCKYITNEYK